MQARWREFSMDWRLQFGSSSWCSCAMKRPIKFRGGLKRSWKAKTKAKNNCHVWLYLFDDIWCYVFYSRNCPVFVQFYHISSMSISTVRYYGVSWPYPSQKMVAKMAGESSFKSPRGKPGFAFDSRWVSGIYFNLRSTVYQYISI